MITRNNRQDIVIPRSAAIAAAALLGALWVADAPRAQDAGEVTVDVERCLALESPDERQACFAAQVDEALQQRGAAEPGAEAEARQAARDNETRNRAAAPASPAASAATEGFEPEEFFGTIVEMREYLPSAYIIRLDNGQIWEQTEPKRYSLRPGLEVRIYSTRWGSRYRLTGLDSGGHIQVRRVR